MSDNSAIEWTDATWNPVRGCVKVSPGCKHCYAETFAERWRGVKGHAYEQGFDPQIVPHKLVEPLTWKEPRLIFVNSMSDLFQDGVPDLYIAACFGVMAAAQRHTFQVLTKRADRLPLWFNEYMPALTMEHRGIVAAPCQHETTLRAAFDALHHDNRLRLAQPWDAMKKIQSGDDYASLWPLRNVQVGVSVEDRKYGLPRIEHLRKVPAAIRFLSIEPLLEDLGTIDLTGIGWVIVGGESGHGARPMHPAWVRSIRDQCVAAKVPFFFKQWGAWAEAVPTAGGDLGGEMRAGRVRIVHAVDREEDGRFIRGDAFMRRTMKKTNGRALDGRTWDEMPARST